MDLPPILALQHGTVARRQLLEAEWVDHDVRRALRRRDLSVLHPGVYVDHTGSPTWLQRAWGAVLHAGDGAALIGASALRADDGPGSQHDDAGPVRVGVPLHRTVRPVAGALFERRAHLAEHVRWVASPPRLRYEEAALDVALAARDELDAVAALARACGTRRTTADRLLTSLEQRARVQRRGWLRDVLQDIASGTCSVLEHAWLDRVERPHGLPTAERQQRVDGLLGARYRDAAYAGMLVVELDGRLHHSEAAQRDADLERDLDSLLGGEDTVRLGWGQVLQRSCATAAKVGVLLQQRGWAGAAHPCGPDCAVEAAARRSA